MSKSLNRLGGPTGLVVISAVVLSVLVWATAATSAVAQVELSAISIDINSGTDRTEPGFTPLRGQPGASVAAQGVTFSIVGNDPGEHRDRGNASVHGDFAFNDGSGSSVGVRITHLPAGEYDLSSWHYDVAPHDGLVDIVWRRVGTAGSVIVTDVDIRQPEVERYTVSSDGASVYELVVRPASGSFRARLNGFRLEPADPTPGLLQPTCESGFCLIEDFDDLANGSIRDQGEWITNPPGEKDGALVVDTPVPDFSGKALRSEPNGVLWRGSAYHPLGGNAIRQGDTGTLFFRASTEIPGRSYTHIGLTDLAAPRINSGNTGELTIYEDFEVHFSFGVQGFRVKDGQDSLFLTNLEPLAGQVYDIWLVADNQADTYQVYIGGGQYLTPQLGTVDGQATFKFRNGSNTADLVTFEVLSSPSRPTSTVHIDDIHVDPDTRNLNSPLTGPDFVAVDSFGGLTDGPLGTRNSWSTSSAGVEIRRDPDDPGNAVMALTTAAASAHHSVPRAIVDGDQGTLFFRMRRAGNVNSSIGLSDAAEPMDFPDFENQIYVPRNADGVSVRDGATFDSVGQFDPDQWHCVWMVTDNASDTFQTWMQGGPYDQPTLLSSGPQDQFAYRNGTTASLNRFFVKQVISPSTTYIDDVYIAVGGLALEKPTDRPCG